jgi:hypothetical protein
MSTPTNGSNALEMKGLVSISFLALAAILTAPTAAVYKCNKNQVSGPVYRYQIRSTDRVPDVPGICGGLWDNLKRFGECGSASNTWCGDTGNGILGWDFTAFVGCNSGMVESTWWEATRNQWGTVDCDE